MTITTGLSSFVSQLCSSSSSSAANNNNNNGNGNGNDSGIEGGATIPSHHPTTDNNSNNNNHDDDDDAKSDEQEHIVAATTADPSASSNTTQKQTTANTSTRIASPVVAAAAARRVSFAAGSSVSSFLTCNNNSNNNNSNQQNENTSSSSDSNTNTTTTTISNTSTTTSTTTTTTNNQLQRRVSLEDSVSSVPSVSSGSGSSSSSYVLGQQQRTNPNGRECGGFAARPSSQQQHYADAEVWRTTTESASGHNTDKDEDTSKKAGTEKQGEEFGEEKDGPTDEKTTSASSFQHQHEEEEEKKDPHRPVAIGGGGGASAAPATAVVSTSASASSSTLMDTTARLPSTRLTSLTRKTILMRTMTQNANENDSNATTTTTTATQDRRGNDETKEQAAVVAEAEEVVKPQHEKRSKVYPRVVGVEVEVGVAQTRRTGNDVVVEENEEDTEDNTAIKNKNQDSHDIETVSYENNANGTIHSNEFTAKAKIITATDESGGSTGNYDNSGNGWNGNEEEENNRTNIINTNTDTTTGILNSSLSYSTMPLPTVTPLKKKPMASSSLRIQSFHGIKKKNVEHTAGNATKTGGRSSSSRSSDGPESSSTNDGKDLERMPTVVVLDKKIRATIVETEQPTAGVHHDAETIAVEADVATTTIVTVVASGSKVDDGKKKYHRRVEEKKEEETKAAKVPHDISKLNQGAGISPFAGSGGGSSSIRFSKSTATDASASMIAVRDTINDRSSNNSNIHHLIAEVKTNATYDEQKSPCDDKLPECKTTTANNTSADVEKVEKEAIVTATVVPTLRKASSVVKIAIAQPQKAKVPPSKQQSEDEETPVEKGARILRGKALSFALSREAAEEQTDKQANLNEEASCVALSRLAMKPMRPQMEKELTTTVVLVSKISDDVSTPFSSPSEKNAKGSTNNVCDANKNKSTSTTCTITAVDTVHTATAAFVGDDDKDNKSVARKNMNIFQSCKLKLSKKERETAGNIVIINDHDDNNEVTNSDRSDNIGSKMIGNSDIHRKKKRRTRGTKITTPALLETHQQKICSDINSSKMIGSSGIQRKKKRRTRGTKITTPALLATKIIVTVDEAVESSNNHNHSIGRAVATSVDTTTGAENQYDGIENRVAESFPIKLHRLLLETERIGQADIISFVFSGRAFAIHKVGDFVQKILPYYFPRETLLCNSADTQFSLKRQLNLYGFRLIRTGPARGEGYFHKLFLRDQPELCHEMRRIATVTLASTTAATSALGPVTIPITSFENNVNISNNNKSFVNNSGSQVTATGDESKSTENFEIPVAVVQGIARIDSHQRYHFCAADDRNISSAAPQPSNHQDAVNTDANTREVSLIIPVIPVQVPPCSSTLGTRGFSDEDESNLVGTTSSQLTTKSPDKPATCSGSDVPLMARKLRKRKKRDNQLDLFDNKGVTMESIYNKGLEEEVEPPLQQPLKNSEKERITNLVTTASSQKETIANDIEEKVNEEESEATSYRDAGKSNKKERKKEKTNSLLCCDVVPPPPSSSASSRSSLGKHDDTKWQDEDSCDDTTTTRKIKGGRAESPTSKSILSSEKALPIISEALAKVPPDKKNHISFNPHPINIPARLRDAHTTAAAVAVATGLMQQTLPTTVSHCQNFSTSANGNNRSIGRAVATSKEKVAKSLDSDDDYEDNNLDNKELTGESPRNILKQGFLQDNGELDMLASVAYTQTYLVDEESKVEQQQQHKIGDPSTIQAKSVFLQSPPYPVGRKSSDVSLSSDEKEVCSKEKALANCINQRGDFPPPVPTAPKAIVPLPPSSQLRVRSTPPSESSTAPNSIGSVVQPSVSHQHDGGSFLEGTSLSFRDSEDTPAAANDDTSVINITSTDLETKYQNASVEDNENEVVTKTNESQQELSKARFGNRVNLPIKFRDYDNTLKRQTKIKSNHQESNASALLRRSIPTDSTEDDGGETVCNRIMNGNNIKHVHYYDVNFDTKTLGIGFTCLKNTHTIVTANILSDKYKDIIHPHDFLISINGYDVLKLSCPVSPVFSTLKVLKNMIVSLPRPIKIRFARITNPDFLTAVLQNPKCTEQEIITKTKSTKDRYNNIATDATSNFNRGREEEKETNQLLRQKQQPIEDNKISDFADTVSQQGTTESLSSPAQVTKEQTQRHLAELERDSKKEESKGKSMADGKYRNGMVQAERAEPHVEDKQRIQKLWVEERKRTTTALLYSSTVTELEMRTESELLTTKDQENISATMGPKEGYDYGADVPLTDAHEIVGDGADDITVLHSNCCADDAHIGFDPPSPEPVFIAAVAPLPSVHVQPFPPEPVFISAVLPSPSVDVQSPQLDQQEYCVAEKKTAAITVAKAEVFILEKEREEAKVAAAAALKKERQQREETEVAALEKEQQEKKDVVDAFAAAKDEREMGEAAIGSSSLEKGQEDREVAASLLVNDNNTFDTADIDTDTDEIDNDSNDSDDIDNRLKTYESKLSKISQLQELLQEREESFLDSDDVLPEEFEAEGRESMRQLLAQIGSKDQDDDHDQISHRCKQDAINGDDFIDPQMLPTIASNECISYTKVWSPDDEDNPYDATPGKIIAVNGQSITNLSKTKIDLLFRNIREHTASRKDKGTKAYVIMLCLLLPSNNDLCHQRSIASPTVDSATFSNMTTLSSSYLKHNRCRTRSKKFDTENNNNVSNNDICAKIDHKLECEFCGIFFANGRGLMTHQSLWCKKRPSAIQSNDDNERNIDDDNTDEVPQKRRHARSRRLDDDEIDNDNVSNSDDNDMDDDKVSVAYQGEQEGQQELLQNQQQKRIITLSNKSSIQQREKDMNHDKSRYVSPSLVQQQQRNDKIDSDNASYQVLNASASVDSGTLIVRNEAKNSKSASLKCANIPIDTSKEHCDDNKEENNACINTMMVTYDDKKESLNKFEGQDAAASTNRDNIKSTDATKDDDAELDRATSKIERARKMLATDAAYRVSTILPKKRTRTPTAKFGENQVKKVSKEKVTTDDNSDDDDVPIALLFNPNWKKQRRMHENSIIETLSLSSNSNSNSNSFVRTVVEVDKSKQPELTETFLEQQHQKEPKNNKTKQDVLITESVSVDRHKRTRETTIASPHQQVQASLLSLPSQVVSPHFPTLIHYVLIDEEFDGKIVQWLPNGEAWRVIKWDAMRREILPVYFPDLEDESGVSCGTIDAFLYHLDAWGFEEIPDGEENAGAYQHALFLRGALKLCTKMTKSRDVGFNKNVSNNSTIANAKISANLMVNLNMDVTGNTKLDRNTTEIQQKLTHLLDNNNRKDVANNDKQLNDTVNSITNNTATNDDTNESENCDIITDHNTNSTTTTAKNDETPEVQEHYTRLSAKANVNLDASISTEAETENINSIGKGKVKRFGRRRVNLPIRFRESNNNTQRQTKTRCSSGSKEKKRRNTIKDTTTGATAVMAAKTPKNFKYRNSTGACIPASSIISVTSPIALQNEVKTPIKCGKVIHQCSFCSRIFSTKQGLKYHLDNNVCGHRHMCNSAKLLSMNGHKQETEKATETSITGAAPGPGPAISAKKARISLLTPSKGGSAENTPKPALTTLAPEVVVASPNSVTAGATTIDNSIDIAVHEEGKQSLPIEVIRTLAVNDDDESLPPTLSLEVSARITPTGGKSDTNVVTINATFYKRKLGLVIGEKVSHKRFYKEIMGTNLVSDGDVENKIKVGDRLLFVAGIKIDENKSIKDVRNIIASSPRPLQIVFERRTRLNKDKNEAETVAIAVPETEKEKAPLAVVLPTESGYEVKVDDNDVYQEEDIGDDVIVEGDEKETTTQICAGSESSCKRLIRRLPRKLLGDTTDMVLMGGMTLSHPEDSDRLNMLHCFVRSTLVEVFALKPGAAGKRIDHQKNIVGIRCSVCGTMPAEERGTGTMSAFYPKSLQDIYRGVCTWQRIHFPKCEHMPEEYKEKYKSCKENDLSRGKKNHWITSAYEMGLRNVDFNRSGVTYDPETKKKKRKINDKGLQGSPRKMPKKNKCKIQRKRLHETGSASNSSEDSVAAADVGTYDENYHKQWSTTASEMILQDESDDNLDFELFGMKEFGNQDDKTEFK